MASSASNQEPSQPGGGSPAAGTLALDQPEGGHSTSQPAGESEERILAHRVGWIAGVDAGALLVDFRGNPRGPIRARTTVALDSRAALDAATHRQEAVLAFEDGDPARPLVVGLVQPPIPTMIDLVLEGAGQDPATEPSADEAAAAETRAAIVDGKRLVLEGEDEVVLRCGEASITLRRNGKVVIRGAYVESHAAGTNRIKGGSVRIN